MAEEVTGARLNELREVRGELAAMRSDLSEIRDDIRVFKAMAVRQDNQAMRTLDLLHDTLDIEQLRLARQELRFKPWQLITTAAALLGAGGVVGGLLVRLASTQ